MNAPTRIAAGAPIVAHGLPGALPPGERVLWQGAPQTGALARAALHTRAVAIYFAALVAVGLAMAAAHRTVPLGALATAGCGIAAVALLRLLAWTAASSATYTLTDRRIVLRIGMALPRSINLPLDRIAAIDLSTGGDVVLRLSETAPLGWLALWPHARPWRLSRPEPMLRCLPDAADVAATIGRACAARTAHHPAAPAARPHLAAAVAA